METLQKGDAETLREKMSSLSIAIAGIPFEVEVPERFRASVERLFGPYSTKEEPLFTVGPSPSYGQWVKSVVPGLGDEEIYHDEIMHEAALRLLKYGCLLLHAAVIAVDGRAYAFSAPSGIGKSTHVKLWKEHFGNHAFIVNGDKPFLCRREDGWWAYPSPWAGKEGWQTRKEVPLQAICFLEQGSHNAIRPIDEIEETDRLLVQTEQPATLPELDFYLALEGKLIAEVPGFVLTCLPNAEAARLSYTILSGKDDWNHAGSI